MERMDLINLKDDYEKENAASLCYQMSEYSNFNYLDKMNKEIEILKSELEECRKKCIDKELEICNVQELKDKGLFVLRNVEETYKNLDDGLKDIHNNYVKCVVKIQTYEENADDKVTSLKQERDNLKQELEEFKKTTDENTKKLIEIKKSIIMQEKKNMALLRKLRKQVQGKHITEEVRQRINTILNDPRIIKPNLPN